MDLFKSSKDVEKGVSIKDLDSPLKILGDNNSNLDNNGLKLSQFKQIKSSFKPRISKFAATLKHSSFGLPNEASNSTEMNKEQAKLRLGSLASSRLMTSSFSPFMERSGRINKNEKTYTAYF
jgi:hypothetical protein